MCAPDVPFLLIRSPFSFLFLPQTVKLLTSLLSPKELSLQPVLPLKLTSVLPSSLPFHSPRPPSQPLKTWLPLAPFFLHPHQLGALCQGSSWICLNPIPNQVTGDNLMCSLLHTFPHLLLGFYLAFSEPAGDCVCSCTGFSPGILLNFWGSRKGYLILLHLNSFPLFLFWAAKKFFPLSLPFRLSFFPP